MYICLCNPFSDKKVKNFFAKLMGKTTVSETYKKCSGGKNPECCTCICALREMVDEHNETVSTQNLPTKEAA